MTNKIEEALEELKNFGSGENKYKDFLTFREGSLCDEWGDNLTCPECNSDYVHFCAPIFKKDKDDYSCWEGRGQSLEIPCWCEGNHQWKIRLGFHKGNTYIKVIDVGYNNEPWELPDQK